MHASNFTVRKALPKDRNQLAKLFVELRCHTFYWQDPNQFKFKDFIKQTTGESIFLAEDEKKNIVGFISVMPEENPPFIHHLFVKSDHQRKGIGTSLIHSLFTWLPLPYQLKCLGKNKNALDYYKKTGWIEIEHGMCEDDEEYHLLELHQII